MLLQAANRRRLLRHYQIKAPILRGCLWPADLHPLTTQDQVEAPPLRAQQLYLFSELAQHEVLRPSSTQKYQVFQALKRPEARPLHKRRNLILKVRHPPEALLLRTRQWLGVLAIRKEQGFLLTNWISHLVLHPD